jgi:rhomboid protease GluP
MTDADMHPLEKFLILCARAAPDPWYPSVYAQEAAIPREQIDPYLDQLRLGGFIHLTDWVQGRGQGYKLTEDGSAVLKNPRDLARLRAGTLYKAPERQTASLDLRERPNTAWQQGEMCRAALLDRSPGVVTGALIFLNVAVFLAGMALAVQSNLPLTAFLMPSADPRYGAILRETGAAFGPDVLLYHQWWRLLTCCFVHAGVMHLGLNLFSLYAIGPVLERMWGRLRFLAIYLIAGVGGSCAVVYLQPRAQLVGASGALFGIVASLVAWLLLNRAHLPGPWVSDVLRRVGGVFLLNVFFSFLPGISATAHFAGAGFGAAAAVLLHVHRFSRGLLRALALSGVLLLATAPVGLLLREQASKRLFQDPVYAEHLRTTELRHFVTLVRDKAESPLEQAQQLFLTRAAPLLKQAPDKRSPDAVRDVVKELTESQDHLTASAGVFQRAGPYHVGQVEKARQAMAALLEGQARLMGLAAQSLQNGGDWTDDELAQQRQEAKRLDEKLDEAMSQFR